MTLPRPRRLGRGLDVLVGATGLVLAAPLLLLAVLGSWVDGGPGVLLRRPAVGARGERVWRHRLRTRCWGDETDVPGQQPYQARVSLFGRLLELTHADALPGVVDLLLGRTSLIGSVSAGPGTACRPRRPRTRR